MEDLKPTTANSTPLTPLAFLERAALIYGDCPSLIYNSTTYTWSHTYHRCLKVASMISALGIGKHQVVSVVAPNVPAAYELHFGVPMAGAILSNINTRLNATTISLLLQHSESKLIFVYHQHRTLVLEALSLLPSYNSRPLLILISDDDDNESPTNEFYATYEELICRGDPEFQWVPPANEWDPIVLNYTSGITSSPKGVVHCHRGSYISTMSSLIEWSVPKQPVFLWTLPMFHSNGWCFTWGMAAIGATNICLRHFDGATIYNAINHHHVSHMCAAPVVLNMLVNQSHIGKPIREPVQVLTGGSPPPAIAIVEAEKRGFIVSHVYGLTETGGPALMCTKKIKWDALQVHERAKLLARQGVWTLAMAEVNVVHPATNKPVKRDGKTIGEIVMRGSSVMFGYFNNHKETLNCMRKEYGWFRTGDLGVMHKDGYIEIKDRSKDIIISGGENISSVDVESVLYTIPAVNEAAVVAQPHDYWGETPCAFLCLKTDVEMKPSEREIIDYCRKKLPHYMVPKRVVFIDELPKNSNGKFLKFELRDMARKLPTISPHSSRL